MIPEKKTRHDIGMLREWLPIPRRPPIPSRPTNWVNHMMRHARQTRPLLYFFLNPPSSEGKLERFHPCMNDPFLVRQRNTSAKLTIRRS